jgi:hypothetical protein
MPRFYAVHTLNKHFRNLTQAAFQRYGFAYAELLQQWPSIVGAELADVSRPERLKWPRRADGAEDRGMPGGGTLIVRALHGRALELHYMAPRIMERINGFYGYGAIAEIKVLQGSLPTPPVPHIAPANPDPAKLTALEKRLEAIADDKLRAALTRLGTGALANSGNARKMP